MKFLLFAAPLMFAVAGCRSKPAGYVPAPPPKVEPVTKASSSTEIMPLQLGNEWTFGLKSEIYTKGKKADGADQTVTIRVESVDGNKATLSIEQEKKVVDRQVWQTTSAGIYQLVTGLNNVPFSPAQPVALFPMDKGRNFQWTGTGQMPDGTKGQGKALGQILPAQDVDTGIGTLSAIPVATIISYSGRRCDNTTWFRPGIGMVRLRQDLIQKDSRVILTLTLSKYALNK